MIQSTGEDDEESDDDDDADESFDSSGTIFGITTALSISKPFASGCLEELRHYFAAKVAQHAPAVEKSKFLGALNDDDKRLGFIVSERFVNIPPQIAVPLLENLSKEVTRAAKKKEKYAFTHYVMLIKFYRRDAKKNKATDGELIYSNVEEEILCENCDASFEYSVQSETDSGLSGNWTESDKTLTPYRKLVLFGAPQLPAIIESIKAATSEE